MSARKIGCLLTRNRSIYPRSNQVLPTYRRNEFKTLRLNMAAKRAHFQNRKFIKTLIVSFADEADLGHTCLAERTTMRIKESSLNLILAFALACATAVSVCAQGQVLWPDIPSEDLALKD